MLAGGVALQLVQRFRATLSALRMLGEAAQGAVARGDLQLAEFLALEVEAEVAKLQAVLQEMQPAARAAIGT
jgi:hypothetical protein